MKAKYIQPTIQIITLTPDESILLSISNTKVDTHDKGFEQRSNEKDMWGNENIWK